MTPRDHVADAAAGIVALSAHDPERIAAMQHAKGCGVCAEALDDAEQLFALLAEAPPPPPRAEMLARLERSIVSRTHAPRRPISVGLVAAVVASWGGVALMAKSHAHDVDRWVLSAATALVAVALVAVARARGPWALVATIVTSLVIALANGPFAGIGSIHGVVCFSLELMAAAIPFGAFAYVALRERLVSSSWTFASVAAGGALAGQAALFVTCPEWAQEGHLLMTHTAGVLVAAALGGLGRSIIASRVASSAAVSST